jgi:hypothetical protein
MKKYYYLELDRYDLTESTRKIIKAPNAKAAFIEGLEDFSPEEVEEMLGDEAVVTDDEIKVDSEERGYWVFPA